MHQTRLQAMNRMASVSTLCVRVVAVVAVLPTLLVAEAASAAGAPAGLRPAPLPPDAPVLSPAEICFPLEPLDDTSGDVDADLDDLERDPDLDVEPERDGVASDGAAAVDPEAEVHDSAGTGADGALRYSADISDEELKARWEKHPETLGSMSIGFTDSGRLINAVPFPREGNWIVVDPRDAWGTKETVDSIVAAIEQVNARMPDTPPLRVNDISSKEGGWLRGHRSHQAGRDVDLGFYYPTAEPIRIRARETCIDVARNWALVRALVTTGDVQSILVDRRVQAVLYRYALTIGEDKAWLDSLFHGGPDALVKHARRHRDHFHVRYHNGRSQELGRRVQPLLAMRPEHNVTTHKVRRGDTLGAIAKRYGTSVAALKKKNGMKNTFLRLGRVLSVPLRGPCTQCPLPPPVVVPPRRLPPDFGEAVDVGPTTAAIADETEPAMTSALLMDGTTSPGAEEASASVPLVPDLSPSPPGARAAGPASPRYAVPLAPRGAASAAALPLGGGVAVPSAGATR